MALDTERILTDIADRVEADGRFVDQDGNALEGDDLDDARKQLKDGARYMIAAIIDEVTANAEVATTVSGTAATDGILDDAGDELTADAPVSGSGAGGVS